MGEAAGCNYAEQAWLVIDRSARKSVRCAMGGSVSTAMGITNATGR
jgi:hypothetical protein